MFQSILGLLFPASGAVRARKRKSRKPHAETRISANTFAAVGDGGAPAIPRVLVADLVRDSGDAMGKLVSDVLGNSGEFEVVRPRQTLKLGRTGALVDQLYAATEEGRDLIQDNNADLLLWGEVQGPAAIIRFIPAAPVSESRAGAFGMGDMLYLNPALGEGLEAALISASLAAVGAGYRGARGRLGKSLNKHLQGVGHYVQEKPPDLDSGQYAALLTCIGNSFAAHAYLGGPVKRLTHATAAYKIAVKQISAEQAPVTWSLAQSHLAAVLRARGDKEKDQDILKQAAAVYGQITDSLSRVDQPFDWALAHVNKGLVLYRIGVRTGRAAYYQDSSRSFEEALGVYTKEITPAKWAEVTNQYGVVLMALGELVTGNVTLELAVKRFRMALEIRKRDRMPTLWAQTANNLGAACFALSKRNSDVALLREASTCFEGAMEVYRESGETRKAEIISSNLSRVQRLLMAREG